MSKRKPTNPKDIAEIENLKIFGYDVKFWQSGTWLIDDWLFVYPKNQKDGERYRQVYGHYKRGTLKSFVELANENKFIEKDIFYGAEKLDKELIK